jgi:deoxycytidylate deaminase
VTYPNSNSANLAAIRALFPTLRDEHFRGRRRDSYETPIEAAAAAAVASLKSPCLSKRGVVVWNPRDGHRINVGWNDQPFGFRCDGSAACKANCGRTAIHAEEAAILATTRDDLRGASMIHIKTVEDLAFPSGPPSCVRCSGMILESGIGSMWLLHDDGLREYSAQEFHAETLRTLGLYAVHEYTKVDSIIAAVRGAILPQRI